MFWLKRFIVVMVLVFILGSVVSAQETDAAATPAGGGHSISWLDQVSKGGTIGWIIIAVSVIALGLTIEAFVKIRKDKIMPVDLLQELEVLFENEEYQEALDATEADHSPFAKIISAGLNKISSGYEAMVDSVFDNLNESSMKLQQKIGWISLLSNISPMLGLFGTVSGMIVTFDMIANAASAPSPKDLAGGISIALVTTFLGLIVAIPTSVVYFILRNKVNNIMNEVSGISMELFEKFRPVE